MEEKELLQNKGAEEIAPLLDAKDVARILKRSVKTVHKRVREGKLGCVQVTPQDRRFTREQVQAFIEAQSTGVRVDKKGSKSVPSAPKKGGDNTESRQEKAKDSWASLKKEMSRWT
ncbi:MAG: helix-turn-helix domain-containing protein [Desulfomonilaceae bacterium]